MCPGASNKFIDCSGLSKEEVLVHLYNAAYPSIMGWFQGTSDLMKSSEALEILDRNWNYVDSVHGRPLNIYFGVWPFIDSTSYDREQGPGTMARVIAGLRDVKTNTPKKEEHEKDSITDHGV